MKTRWFFGALVVVLAAVPPVGARFVWLLPEGTTGVRVVFGEAPKAGTSAGADNVSPTVLSVRDATGAPATVKAAATDGGVSALAGDGPRVVLGSCRYGVARRGELPPFLLLYYAKTLVGCTAGEALPTHLSAAWDGVPLQFVPVAGSPAVRVLWQGRPQPDVEVTVHAPTADAPVVTRADREGLVKLPALAAEGYYGLRASVTELKEGEHQGKKYQEIRHYATFTVEHRKDTRLRPVRADAPVTAAAAATAPDASQLLAEARAARAVWEAFPGFVADLETNHEGRVVRGRVEIGPKGKVQLELADAAAREWARRVLTAVAQHRLDNNTDLKTNCAFVDDRSDHPHGRGIKVLDDPETRSTYRVRDRQILAVNRIDERAGTRLSIVVTENRVNPEKKYLPVSYVVTTWNLKSGELRSTETNHQSWSRVGKFDLPRTVTVVTATSGLLETRRLTLTNHELLP